jgi:hypothetical protein
MTEQNTHAPLNWQYTAPPAPEKPKPWWKKAVVILPVAAFVLGSGLGVMNKPDPVTVPGPERIVEKRVEVTPQSCLTALDLSGEGFGYAGQIIGYLNDAVQAAGRLNAAGLREANANMEVVSPKFSALVPKAKAAEAECRASGS